MLTVATTSDRYLALSGGGWNAHSSHAGLLAGAMDALAATGKDNNIDNLLGQVKKLSSSSGGTWFSTQLSYADAFRKQFESRSGRDSYTTSGYNGELRKLFEGLGYNADGSVKLPPLTGAAKLSFDLLNKGLDLIIQEVAKLTGVAEKTIRTGLDTALFTGSLALDTTIKSGISWLGFVNNYVNKPLDISGALNGLTLESSRNPWAQDVDLILPGVMQTSEVALGSYLNQLNIPAVVTHRATPNGSVPSQLHFTPVSLISKAGSSAGANPTGQALFTAGDFTSTYQGEVLGVRTGRAVKKVIPSSLSNKLDIATVSAISSAAVGMLAGPDSLTSSLFDNPNIPALAKAALNTAQDAFAVLMKDLAPGVSIQNGILGPVPQLSASQRNVSGAADVGGVRMADSGYLDNSAVACLVRDIQESKGTASPFNITLWMQSNEAADPVTGLNKRVRIAADASSLSTFGLPSEVPQIFGQSKGDGSLDGDRIIQALSPPGLPIYVPAATIFDPSAWYGKTKADWSYSKDNINLSYFNLDVTTVDNKTFGIKAGQSGKLHIFNAVNPESFAAPLNFGYLNEYDQNYSVIRDAIANGGGFNVLKDALGITV